MGYGNALGGLAGGFAQGYNMAQDNKRRNADDLRRQEEHNYLRQQRDLEKQIREGTGQYIATEGQEVTTDYTMAPGATGNLDSGDVYTPTRKKQTQEGAWQGAARHAARLGADPTRVAQIETTGLQLSNARREEGYKQDEQDVNDFLAKNQGLSDPEFYRAAAKFATRWGNDGKAFGVDQDGQGRFHLVMTADGGVKRAPITNRGYVERLLLSYASPAGRQRAEQLGLEERKVGAQERTAAATEQWRSDQRPVLEAQAKAHNAHAGVYGAMEAYYRAGGPTQGRGGGNFERLPEGEKILLQSRERQQQAILAQLGKVEPDQQGPLMQQMQQLRREEYDHLKKLKLLPDGVSKTQYLGLPDPMQLARQAMSGARGEQEFRASMEQFEALYGDAPEAAQAFNAMQVFMNQMYYNKVRPQTQPGLMPTSTPRLPVGQYYRGQGSFSSGLVAPNQ